MSENEKCPFCGEPSIRRTVCGTTFRCGTLGPDINDEYSTGRTCDITTWSRLLQAKDAEIERLKAYTAAYNTLLAERVEIECLRGLAIRAWHSFRSGLTAGGGCDCGLTDADIEELVRLSGHPPTDAATYRRPLTARQAKVLRT